MEQSQRVVRRVLVVDDEEKVRTRALDEMSSRYVEVASCFDEGLERALAGNFDLVIIDNGLGNRLSGFHLAMALREEPIEARIALFSSGFTAPQMLEAVARSLPADIICRPKLPGDFETIIHVAETGVDHLVDDRRKRRSETYNEAKRRLARDIVINAIKLYQGNKTHAARYLDINRRTLDRILGNGDDDDDGGSKS